MAGLQLICAMFCKFIVIRSVELPSLAAAAAASLPACPAPTTITSYTLSNIKSIPIVPRGTFAFFPLPYDASASFPPPSYHHNRRNVESREPLPFEVLQETRRQIPWRSP